MLSYTSQDTDANDLAHSETIAPVVPHSIARYDKPRDDWNG